jgi:hypothetical protein
MALASKTVVGPTSFPTFSKVKDVKEEVGFNGVIFGPPGIGKTTFISGFAELGPMLLFDIDAGRESVVDVDNLFLADRPSVAEARSKGLDVTGMDKKFTWDELRGYLDIALSLKGDSPYRTYGFDSLSSIYYELLLPKVVGSETKKVEWPHYSEAQRLLTKFIRDAKSLCEYGINTVFTGHVKEENDGEITNVRLALPQGVRNEILLAVNHVGFLTRAKNSEVRELHFTPPRRVDGPKLRQTRSGKQAPLVLTDPTALKLLDSLKRVK